MIHQNEIRPYTLGEFKQHRVFWIGVAVLWTLCTIVPYIMGAQK